MDLDLAEDDAARDRNGYNAGTCTTSEGRPPNYLNNFFRNGIVNYSNAINLEWAWPNHVCATPLLLPAFSSEEIFCDDH
ncbi:unnamed protein product [Strongylus vulgaris]|uniref:Uncharacterized protein n=1 Tax=Strongylus vulgaris TaxID=40348 RepID=A0A3P7L0V4_STRVU|nr:unnamed protein product [Strongylus vulgaris]